MAETFALQPERYSVRYQREAVSSDPYTGGVRTRQTHTAVSADSSQAEGRIFTLLWEYASESDTSVIDGYLETDFGHVVPMEWTPPQAGAAISVRIANYRSSSATPTGGVRIVVELEEVL